MYCNHLSTSVYADFISDLSSKGTTQLADFDPVFKLSKNYSMHNTFPQWLVLASSPPPYGPTVLFHCC